MATLDEQLDVVNEEAEEKAIQRERAENFAATQQRQRLAEQQAEQEQEEIERQQAQSIVRERAESGIKTAGKDYAKKAAKKAIWEFLVATFPYWGPVLGIIILVVGIIALAIAGAVAYCNESSVARFSVKVISKVTSLPDFCSALSFDGFQGGASGGAGATGNFGGYQIVITSAFRPGSVITGTGTLSAHGRGEAVDIALRPVPTSNADPRIAQLVQIVRSQGFVPIVGDTLDEYNRPTEGATGGHIHIEFNLKTDGSGQTYCDNSVIPATGPTDLVSLVGSVPVNPSASDPRVRECMFGQVIGIFNAAGAIPVSP